ncbi:MAG: DUF2723 domain-containing protein [Candidatus Riflebacteria bacterium]|nr:DUF2723 domain-containing protein [Candidatus Riflebacteria bacterium]
MVLELARSSRSCYTFIVMTRIAPGALLVGLLSAALVAHFFKPYPDGWDAAEYCWCVRSDYLPHSPYLGYFGLGKLFAIFLDPPIALSSLSFVGGIASIGLLHAAQLALLRSDRPAARTGDAAVVATVSALLLGSSYLFIRQSGTQEVYAIQTALLLLALVLLASRSGPRLIASGLVYGFALAVHQSSVFVLPALAFAVFSSQPDRRSRNLLLWLGAAAAVAGAACLVLYALLPVDPAESRILGLLRYLRGISPSPPVRLWLEPRFWADSASGLLDRVTCVDVPVSQLAIATCPVGASWFNVVLAGVGLLVAWRHRLRSGLFWGLYPAPYLAYELGLGRNLDAGLYLPLLLPSLSGLGALTLGRALALSTGSGSLSRPLVGRSLGSLVLLLLLLPSAGLVLRHWEAPDRDASVHHSVWMLAACWMSRHLPRDAVVLQPAVERNVNLLPYYSGLRHALRRGALFMLFEPRGPYTPMNLEAYGLLTTARLGELIRSGRAVYALESDPLARCPEEILDGKLFAWEVERTLAPDEIRAGPGAHQRVTARLPGYPVPLYRGKIR